jgi:methylthioribose-1-phosphate isomerase
MRVFGQHYQTIFVHPEDPKVIQIIDQRQLPFDFVIEDLNTLEDAYRAIREMHVRGAPLIGVTAAFGMYLGMLSYNGKGNVKEYLEKCAAHLKSSRPTAVNLEYAVDSITRALQDANSTGEMTVKTLKLATDMAAQEVDYSRQIGEHGLSLIEKIAREKKGESVNILTHCNAGWLACIDYGTATAPVYKAHQEGIPVHVWVDETRPRNQGARLTAWELGQEGVPHTIIPDNTGGHLMQHGLVDLVITGSDRTTLTGDVANKIGTYLKALAAYDNHVPFYAALPSSTIDWKLTDGVKQIPIEQRDSGEVKYMEGLSGREINKILIMPEKSPVANFGFDVTPARLVTGLITEKGICQANKESILALFPEKNTTQ